MRILFLTHRIPYPPNKGDKIRSFNILRWLSREHDVFLGTLIDDASDLAGLAHLEKIVRAVEYTRIDQPLRRVSSLRAVLNGASITVRHFYSESLQTRIDRIIEREAIDVVFCFSSPTAEYVYRSRHLHGALRRVVKIMDLIDVDSLKWRQYAERSKAWLAWIYRYEAARLATYEQRIMDTFDRLLLVSEQETQHLPAPPGKVVAVSNGVDLQYFTPRESQSPARRPTLVFTGVMDYWPNIEGMRWFISEVLPAVRDRIPDVRLCIVGSKPTAEVQGWDDGSNIVVTGFVEDIREYLAAADVCVVPLRVARGIQNKVLEAMSMGKPVVSTSGAFEGVEAVPGRDLLVATDAGEFAAAVLELLRDRQRALDVGTHARLAMERGYAWDRCLEPLRSILSTSASEASIPEQT